MKQTSAGFLIRSKGLYLLCHITQDPGYIYKETDPLWSIPKGTVEEGESPILTALREVKEETDLDLLSYFDVYKNPHTIKPFHTYTSKHKDYVIFLADEPLGTFLCFKFKCNSIIDNKKYSKRNGLPEHDSFKWTTKEEAYKLVFDSLKHIFKLPNI